MNFATLAPIDYTIGQPQLTPISKRYTDIMTLSDLMDTQRENKRKRASEAAIRDVFARPDITATATVPQLPTPKMAYDSYSGLYHPESMAPAVADANEYPMPPDLVGPPVPEKKMQLIPSDMAQAPAYPEEAIPVQTASLDGVEAPSTEISMDAFVQQANKIADLATAGTTPSPAPVQTDLAGTPAQAEVAPAPIQAEAPAAQGAYSSVPDVGMSKSDMAKYNKLLAIDPDYAEAWASKKVEQNYKIWQMQKADEDIKKEQRNANLKGLALYATGMSAFLDPNSGLTLDSPEAKIMHDQLRELVANTTGGYAGLKPAEETKNFKQFADITARTYMDPIKKAELMLKQAQKPKVEAETKGTEAKTAETVEKTKTIAPESAAKIKLLTEQANALEKKAAVALTKGTAKTKPMAIGVANIVANNGQAVDLFSELKRDIEAGKVDFFDKGIAGEFKNPRVNWLIRMLTEIHGRERSGAAISLQEWKNFQDQILNKKYLITPEGVKAALQGIDDLSGRYAAAAASATGSSDWYSAYKEASKTGTAEKPADKPTGPVQVKNEDDYNKLKPGTPYIDPNGKKRIKGK